MYRVFHHISYHLPRQIWFWKILTKTWASVRPPPLVGPKAQVFPKINFDGTPKCSDPKLSFQPVLGWFFVAKSMIMEQVLLWPPPPLVQHCTQFLPDGKTPCDWRDSCANFQGRPRLLGYNLTISGLHTISDASFAFRLMTKVHYMLCYVRQYSSLICVWVPYLFRCQACRSTWWSLAVGKR